MECLSFISSKQPETAAERAYNILYDLIITGQLKPGEEITRRRMAEITETSVIPVTEAASRLEIIGLLYKSPKNGRTSVALPTLTEMVGNYLLREAIECKVVHILCERGLTKEREQTLRDLANLIDPGSPLSQGELLEGKPHVYFHQQFHTKLAEFTDFNCFTTALSNSCLHYLPLQLSPPLKSTIGLSDASFHTKIVDAIVSGNSELAQTIMRDHIYVVYSTVMYNLTISHQRILDGQQKQSPPNAAEPVSSDEAADDASIP